MYTIEFPKRDLPHAHFLIILEEKYKILTPEAYDQFLCAELSDPKRNPHLFELVRLHMIHGPCGTLNPTCPCMKKRVIANSNIQKTFVHKQLKAKAHIQSTEDEIQDNL